VRLPRTLVNSAVIIVLLGTVLASGWFLQSATAQPSTETLKREFIGKRTSFSQAVIVRTGRLKTIYIAGTTGTGDDLKTQMIAAYQNLVKRLGESGAKPEDLVQTTAFVVNYKPDDFALWQEAVRKVLSHPNLPAATLVGVHSLASARLLFEVEAIAVTGE
jgi:enamine deaminase RidA (YjgF/YER057c/UK114 family)